VAHHIITYHTSHITQCTSVLGLSCLSPNMTMDDNDNDNKNYDYDDNCDYDDDGLHRILSSAVRGSLCVSPSSSNRTVRRISSMIVNGSSVTTPLHHP
jgi:hypothetical protein